LRNRQILDPAPDETYILFKSIFFTFAAKALKRLRLNFIVLFCDIFNFALETTAKITKKKVYCYLLFAYHSFMTSVLCLRLLIYNHRSGYLLFETILSEILSR
jgi:hypothetical protein